jgi:16S rRNA (cytidine1402-2'-O)-methyltransferase
LVAEVNELVDAGARVKDACAEVVAANPGAPSRRELYDAVLRSRS